MELEKEKSSMNEVNSQVDDALLRSQSAFSTSREKQQSQQPGATIIGVTKGKPKKKSISSANCSNTGDSTTPKAHDSRGRKKSGAGSAPSVVNTAIADTVDDNKEES